MNFISAEVPFFTIGNRQCLTAKQIVEDPYLADFVKSFPACFEQDHLRDIVIFYPDGDAPK